MGVTRKTLSVFSLGAIDFMSDKERMARSARLTKEATRKVAKEQKKQTKLLKAQAKTEQAFYEAQVEALQEGAERPVEPLPPLPSIGATPDHVCAPKRLPDAVIDGRKFAVTECECGRLQRYPK